MNMSYCRFYNTYLDLKDCRNALCDGDIDSWEEKQYAKKLIELCQDIYNSYSPEDIDEMGEDESEDE